MTFEEYKKWQKLNQSKAYAESTKKRWRTQAKKAISQAIELSKSVLNENQFGLVHRSPSRGKTRISRNLTRVKAWTSLKRGIVVVVGDCT